MNLSSTYLVRWLPLLAAAGLATSPAAAALGGAATTLQDDAVKLQAVQHVTSSRAGYAVHELTLNSGTVVREFLAPSGAVFAVTWRGPFKPDLSQLLGDYFPRVVAAGRQRHADHRMLAVHAPDLVIESGGRMRAFAGRAYLPELVPATVSLGAIR
ncbi:MAG TPA: DUF2844 domain-containing protein [Burkholderiaceae bacterium]|nr:DUF2844 domain-containing protein [Burkholderiaceae bacterium]